MMKNNDIVTLVCDRIVWPTSDSSEVFGFWLYRMKSYKGCKSCDDSPAYHIYIDPKEIDYDQMINLWALFSMFKIKRREQIEQFLPYLPEEDARDFEKYFLIPWKKRKCKKK